MVSTSPPRAAFGLPDREDIAHWRPWRVSTWSLRTRLHAIAMVASLFAWLAGGLALSWAAAREDAALLDSRLEQVAETVLALAEQQVFEFSAVRQAAPRRLESLITQGSRYAFQIWSRDALLLMHSLNAPDDRPLQPLDRPGFATTGPEGDGQRVFVLPSASGRLSIEVAERLEDRDHMQSAFGHFFFAFLLLSVGPVLLLTSVMLRYALRSVEDSSAQLGQRHALDLKAIEVRNPPAEMAHMVESINHLFRRVDQAMALQRGFIAVAAHELRTPLAGLRAHAQVATRARSENERRQSLSAVMQAVDRSAELLDQLLDLARIEEWMQDQGRALPRTPHVTVCWQSLADRVLPDLRSLPRGAQVRVHLDFAAPRIEGVAFGLQMLLANLLKNALAHSPADGEVRVSTRRDQSGITLTVDDSGPGIAPAEREKVLQRFYRGPGEQVDGTGLGLSIVQAVATAHGAALHLLDAPLGGLRVQVVFPPSVPER